ncbi:MAG TPA: uroporphyrinogen decarboxylase family protein [Thermodesulfobacteriota bacterium]|nr:uroporphyrinogen decarboxylase family protein [Thermodesulfobacteriota bacterium]
MTGREIAQMAFDLKKPPRVPVTLIGGGAWAVHHAGKTFGQIKNDPKQIADVFIRFFRLFQNDLIWTGSNFLNYPVHFLGCPIKDDSADSPGLEGTVIQSLEEIDRLKIERVFQNPTMQAIIRSHHLIADALGRETMIVPTQWAPFTLTARILGMEPLLIATIQEPEKLSRLIRFSTELTWALLEPILEHPDIPGANFSDPVASGDVVSPSTFRKFSAPAIKELVNRVKAKKKYSMVHICGNSTQVLKDVLEINPHCFSLENKVDLKAAREILGGKVCVAGNVSPTGAFLSGRPEQVQEEAKACLAAWGDGGGYILTVGCDFSKNVPMENMKALMSFRK